MKHSLASRGLALLMTLAMLVVMLPTALAAGENPTLTSVTVNPPTAALTVGDTQHIEATVTFSDGSTTPPPGTVTTWGVVDNRTDEVEISRITGTYSLSADVEAIAIPESNEERDVQVKVTVTPPEGYGQAASAVCTITVSPAEPSGVIVTPSTLELAPGGNRSLNATVNPPTADQEVTWRSDNTAVATVSPSGTAAATVTGVAPGETKVYARIKDGTQEAASTVTVQGIVLESGTLTMNERDNRALNYTIYGPSIKDKGVTWTSSDTNVVRVNAGYLYALKEGTATINAKVNGTSYEAQCTVTVKRNTASVITATAAAGEPLSFSGLVSQLQNRCSTVLGYGLLYISGLSVPTNQGTLYYKYTSEGDTGAGVAAGSSYYVSPGTGQMGLSDITFVPKSDFSGTAVISYTGYASGTSFFQGTIEVSVAGQKDVTYTTANGIAVQMDPTDFAVVCRTRTGRDLSYVAFTLPDSSMGTLYYNYLSPQNPGTEVRASTNYKYSGTPSLGQVFFVPATGFRGQAVITYTAWDTNRQSYQGRLVIRVDEDTGEGTIQYTVGQGQRVTFDDDDFNNVSRKLTGYTLDCVRFTLPSSSTGTLYYDYTTSSSRELVSATRSYYRSSYRYLDRVSFLAADGYSGTVYIPFTGWTTNGGSFSGTISIRVGSQADTIRYKATAGKEVEFQSGDFNDVCLTATGSSLRYVRFTELPSTSKGTLYYNYSNGSYSSKVITTRNYYRSSSPYLNQVGFVPSTTFSGTVSIPFTGWSTAGDRFDGTVEVEVSGTTVNSTIYYTTDYRPVTFDAADFRDICTDLDMGALKSVTFTTTSFSGAGHLYSSYDGFRAANTEVRSTTNYYPSQSPSLSEVTFVPKVGYQGTVWISYTGTNTAGKTYQGRVQIVVSPRSYSSYFSDLSSGYSWAAASVDFLYENGIVDGTGGGRYSPGSSITRGQFVTMLDRALALPDSSRQSFSDVDSGSYYAASVRAACALGIVNGYGDGTFRPNAAITRADAMTMLYRALQAMGWSLGGENTGILSYYSDGGEVPSYARGAMSVMVENGILNGTSSGRLAPGQSMTRAEMAAVLARTLTV